MQANLFNNKATLLIPVIIILMTAPLSLLAQGTIKGSIIDKKTRETLIGATVLIENTTIGAATDINGKFTISAIPNGKCNLKISCLSYQSIILENILIERGKEINLAIELEEASLSMDEVVVTAVRRMNSEVAMISEAKAAPVVMNVMSSQLINRTQDKDAGEAVRKMPGVSLVGDRFIVLRGLAQRYNNVWINNMSAPSSEADQRAFSFDVIPGSAIDNIAVLKTTSPEYPADYAGGFVAIQTKSVVAEDAWSFSIGTGFETTSTFKSFEKNPAGSLSALGFNNGKLSLPTSASNSFIHLNPDKDYKKLEKIAKDFNSNWESRSATALPDLRLSFSASKRVYTNGETEISNLTTVNFSNSSSINDKNVSLWGIYDDRYEKPLSLSLNEQTIYKQSAKLSVLHNWLFNLNSNNSFEFRNFLNNTSSNRVVNRYQDKNPNKFKGTELSFTRRLTYSGQLSGKHFITSTRHKLNWVAGYSYADKADPDQKQYDYYMDEKGEWYLPVQTTPNINRISNKLGEHIFSAGINYRRKFTIATAEPELKAGFYGEYKTRDFQNRWFVYLPAYPGNINFYDKTPNEIMGGNYFRNEPGGIQIQEATERSDSYDANNTLAAAYLSAVIPFSQWFTLSGGVRAENNIQQLNGFQQSTGSNAKPLQVENNNLNFFPSAIATLILHPKHQVRLAYSSSINRPEFREIAPYAYYDFEKDVTIHGNTTLKDCRIKGYDLRYEYYPSNNELFSVALFYKDFSDMIELVQMGSLYPITYKYENVPGGKTYGIEVELRKNLAQEGILSHFSVLFNASLIKSDVTYQTGYESRNREMQGQSPYIINAGLFYNNDKIGLSINTMYNVIGKRIVVNGDYSSATTENPDAYIPDTYEMPRNVLDLNITQRLSKRLDLKVSAKDLIADPEELLQTYKDGFVAKREREQSGRKFQISLAMKF